MADSTPSIDLYSNQTPNGIKVTATLEELGLKYNFHGINILENTQKEPWFLEMNPNGRIPALTDIFEDGKKIRLFESGAILQYLIERYDKDHKISYPAGTREAYEVQCWLFFQNAGIGPMQGQATHFRLFAPVESEYSFLRYINEARRLYGILDTHLAKAGTPYIVGDRCTIADLTHYGWIGCAAWSGVDINEFPNLVKWKKHMETRPAIQRARKIPDEWTFERVAGDKAATEKQAGPGREWFKEIVKKQMEEGRRFA